MYDLIIIGYGLLVSQKYRESIDEFVGRKIGLVTLIELESKKESVQSRISEFQTSVNIVYTKPSSTDELNSVVQHSLSKDTKVRVIIATEPQAHEMYLNYCLEHNLDFIVEKPIICPVVSGVLSSKQLKESMDNINDKSRSNTTNGAVMCLSRNSPLYNDFLLKEVEKFVSKYCQPITSIHLHTNSGIWNLNSEYYTREDHPYSFGYGMLMHGAYHYVDIFAQLLKVNLKLYPDDEFALIVNTVAAFPEDQELRIPESTASLIGEDSEVYSSDNFTKHKYGETDLCTVFRLVNKTRNRTLTIGTISFEQTTPSMRSWNKLDDSVYNKLGRTSHTTILVQLATILSVGVDAYKVIEENLAKYKVSGLIRANSNVLPDEDNTKSIEIEDFSNSVANETLLRLWLDEKDTKSGIVSHAMTMDITYALIASIEEDKAVTIQISL